jgi:hypothetical protein
MKAEVNDFWLTGRAASAALPRYGYGVVVLSVKVSVFE